MLARIAVCNHVNVLFVPRADGLEAVELSTVTQASVLSNQTEAVLDRLRAMDKTLASGDQPVDPGLIRARLGAQLDQPMSTADLARAFARRSDMKLVLDRAHLVILVRNGVTNRVWEYQDTTLGTPGWATADRPPGAVRAGEDTLLHPPGSAPEAEPVACPLCGTVHTGACPTGTDTTGDHASTTTTTTFGATGAAPAAVTNAAQAAVEAGTSRLSRLEVAISEVGTGLHQQLARLHSLVPAGQADATVVHHVEPPRRPRRARSRRPRLLPGTGAGVRTVEVGLRPRAEVGGRHPHRPAGGWLRPADRPRRRGLGRLHAAGPGHRSRPLRGPTPPCGLGVSRQDHYTLTLCRLEDGSLAEVDLEVSDGDGGRRQVRVGGGRVATLADPLRRLLADAGLRGRTWTGTVPIEPRTPLRRTRRTVAALHQATPPTRPRGSRRRGRRGHECRGGRLLARQVEPSRWVTGPPGAPHGRSLMPRSLIEQWFPAAIVGAESLRERGSAKAYPPVNFMHVWWARRPLTTSRAAIVASLLPAWPTDEEVAADSDAARVRKALETEFPKGERAYHAWFVRTLGILGNPVAARARIAEARAQGTSTAGNAYGYDRVHRDAGRAVDREDPRLGRAQVVAG